MLSKDSHYARAVHSLSTAIIIIAKNANIDAETMKTIDIYLKDASDSIERASETPVSLTDTTPFPIEYIAEPYKPY